MKKLSIILLLLLIASTDAAPFPYAFWRGSSSAPAAFSPTDVPGLVIWMKADSLALTSGDPVSTWVNSTGSGNNANFTVGKPTYLASTINGLPAVWFGNAVDQLLFTTNVSGSNSTFFIVVSKTNTTTFQSMISIREPAIYTTWSGPSWRGYPGGAIAVDSAVDLNSNPKVVAATFATTNVNLYTAGALSASGASDSLASRTISAVGGDAGGTQRHRGWIAEALVYTNVLSTTNRNLVGIYLATKYGLTWTP